MNGLDFVVIGILVLSMLFGLWRGLIYEVLSLLGWPIAFVLSRLSATGIARWLPIEQEEMRVTAAYVLVFIAALIVWAIVARLIAKLLKAMGSDWTDRVMGALFGILRGGLVVLVLVWLAGLTKAPEQNFWRNSLTSKTLENVALRTKAWLPDSIAQRIHYRIRS
jgi:membrane protein required for colicin V production